jgi:hypothetical protein
VERIPECKNSTMLGITKYIVYHSYESNNKNNDKFEGLKG